MATTICSSLPLVSTDLCCDCPATPAADWEFSAFLRDMELISSLEAKVSSSEAACSLAPCASDWLTDETWPAALATWAALPAISATNRPRGSFALRNTIRTTPPTAMASAMNTSAIQRLDAVVPSPSRAALAARSSTEDLTSLAAWPISSPSGTSFALRSWLASSTRPSLHSRSSSSAIGPKSFNLASITSLARRPCSDNSKGRISATAWDNVLNRSR